MNQIIKHRSRQLIAKSLGAKLVGGEWQKGKIEMYVGMIALKTRLSQPLVTHHLKAMGEMVSQEYRHPRVYFRLSEKFEEIANEYSSKPRILGKNQQEVLSFVTDNNNARPKDICPGMRRESVSIALRSLRAYNLVSFTQDGKARYYSAQNKTV